MGLRAKEGPLIHTLKKKKKKNENEIWRMVNINEIIYI